MARILECGEGRPPSGSRSMGADQAAQSGAWAMAADGVHRIPLTAGGGSDAYPGSDAPTGQIV
jgi:hypothetical protein